MRSTGDFLDVFEDGGLGLDGEEVLLVGGAGREEDVLLPEEFVGGDDIVVDCFFQNEGVVPQLDQVEHFGLDAIPVVAVAAQVLQEAALAPQLTPTDLTRLSRVSSLLWKDSLLAAWCQFLLQFFTRYSST